MAPCIEGEVSTTGPIREALLNTILIKPSKATLGGSYW